MCRKGSHARNETLNLNLRTKIGFTTQAFRSFCRDNFEFCCYCLNKKKNCQQFLLPNRFALCSLLWHLHLSLNPPCNLTSVFPLIRVSSGDWWWSLWPARSAHNRDFGPSAVSLCSSSVHLQHLQSNQITNERWKKHANEPRQACGFPADRP